MKKATKTVFCCTAFGVVLLFSAGAAVAAPAFPASAAGLTAPSPQLCAFYQKRFDDILAGAKGSIDTVIHNASKHGCLINGV